MNDFTKEELKKLKEMFEIVHGNRRNYKIIYELRDKIISMIENYCEHDFDNLILPQDMASIVLNTCKKCRILNIELLNRDEWDLVYDKRIKPYNPYVNVF